MLYIRKIKESAWFLEQKALDSDSVSDLGTTDHELSVWQVAEDKSNLDKIVLALALTRDDTSGIYIVFIDYDNFTSKYKCNILVAQQDGNTAFTKRKSEHKNFILESFWEQGFLAEYIHGLLADEVNYMYYDEPRLLDVLTDAIKNGEITIDELKANNKNKWRKAYEKSVEETL